MPIPFSNSFIICFSFRNLFYIGTTICITCAGNHLFRKPDADNPRQVNAVVISIGIGFLFCLSTESLPLPINSECQGPKNQNTRNQDKKYWIQWSSWITKWIIVICYFCADRVEQCDY